MVGVLVEEELMVGFGREEAPGLQLGDDRTRERLGPSQLRDIGGGDAAQRGVLREESRSKAGAGVGLQAVELSRVMREREINAQ